MTKSEIDEINRCFDDGGMQMFAPTDCKPGTLGKIEVMETRYANGLPIFHPNDVISHDGTLVVQDEFGEELPESELTDGDDSEIDELEEDFEIDD